MRWIRQIGRNATLSREHKWRASGRETLTEKSYKMRNSISCSIARTDSCAQESSYPGNCYTGLPSEDYTLQDTKGPWRLQSQAQHPRGYLDAALPTEDHRARILRDTCFTGFRTAPRRTKPPEAASIKGCRPSQAVVHHGAIAGP